MRYGVFSDVHSNLEALESVLSAFKKEKIQSFLCLGDIVGYGPNPNECIQKIAGFKKAQMTAGSHDYAAVGMKEMTWFNDMAARALTWTKRHLKEESRSFLMRLPRLVDSSIFTLAHGSPRDPIDEYLLSSRQYLDNLEFFRTPICFIGHTHVPCVFYTDSLGVIQHKPLQEGEVFKFDPQGQTIVNAGSVGQPRDGDNRACGVLYDAEKNEIKMIRCSYDIPAVQSKMRQASLPLFLIERLSYGR
jgi:predicted phosphodiesterase